MLKKILLALLMAAVGLAQQKRPVALTAIPTPDGKKITFSQYRGKVVLVAVISTHCEDCIKSLDILSKVQKAMGPQGFQAIAAAGDDNAQYLVEPFVQRYKPGFPVGYLTKEEIIKLAAVPSGKRPVAPIFLFIDKKGFVRFEYYGDDPFFKTTDGSTRSIVGGLLQE